MTITEMELRLDEIARGLGVRIMPDIRGELYPEDIGAWLPRSRRILYRLGMRYSETMCTIAHELGHAYYGDGVVEDHLRDARQESRADRWAAGILISADAYRQAEAIVGSHPGALAAELGVTVEFVHVWRKSHERIFS